MRPLPLIALLLAALLMSCRVGSKESSPQPTNAPGTQEATETAAESSQPEPTASPPENLLTTPTPPTTPGSLVLRWIPLRYTGPADITFLRELLDTSEPVNDEVIFQIEAVLEDERGWQQAGVDFQRATRAPEDLNDGSVDMFVFVSNPDGFPCTGASGELSIVVGCSVGGEFPTDPPCVLIVPDFERSTITVNHEVGHCLRILHNPAPGVMSQFVNDATDWPTADEIAVVRRRLNEP
ncbi:MAG: hypothetical protein WEB00_06985 [Dehalococcoidia bacterium]